MGVFGEESSFSNLKWRGNSSLVFEFPKSSGRLNLSEYSKSTETLSPFECPKLT
jgi:hypothetical protein